MKESSSNNKKIRIELTNVSKKFLKDRKNKSALERFTKLFKKNKDGNEEFWVLDDISLIVREGENLGIIGKNGSGKSTLLRVISEIYRLNTGCAKTDGELVYLTGFGYGLENKLTMRENIFLSGSVMGLSQEAIRERFDEIVEFSGLREYLDTKLFKFSSGMRTRLASSIGLHCVAHKNPDILLLDEVVGGGADKGYQKKSLEKMESLLRGGASVILVSHNLAAIKGYCDRVIWLDNGKIKKIGNASEVVEAYQNEGEKISFDSYPNKFQIEEYTRKNKILDFNFHDKISIITLTHNNSFFKDCFKATLKNIGYKNFEWIIVANGCDKSFFDSLYEIKDSRIKIIKNKENLSFSKANNLAVREATGDYLLFLNDDIEGLPNWLENMIETREKNENVGAVGSVLIYPDNRKKFNRSVNFSDFSVQHKGIKFCLEGDSLRHVNIGKNENPFSVKSDFSIPAVTAACLLVKKALFHSVGGFDEKYNWGSEDVDFCLKLIEKGFFNYTSSKSLLFHHESFSISQKDSDEVRTDRQRNHSIFRKRWYNFLHSHMIDEDLSNCKFWSYLEEDK